MKCIGEMNLPCSFYSCFLPVGNYDQAELSSLSVDNNERYITNTHLAYPLLQRRHGVQTGVSRTASPFDQIRRNSGICYVILDVLLPILNSTNKHVIIEMKLKYEFVSPTNKKLLTVFFYQHYSDTICGRKLI